MRTDYRRYKRPYSWTRAKPMIRTLPSLRAPAAVALAAVLLACSSGQPAAEAAPVAMLDTAAGIPPSPPTAPSDSSSWLAVDPAARTVSLDLTVTAPSGTPSALINGYRAGAARIVVPLNWTVEWNWHSADSTAPHSLVVMVQREKIPLEGGRASFSNAMTRMVSAGLRAGQTDQSTFVAEEAGWYWMMCGVPSHALNGEWLELRVDPEATTASVELKKKA